MDPIVTSSLISGGASLLGGLFGRKSGTSKLRREYQMQTEYIPKQMQAKIQGAKDAGVHPLVALGMPLAGQPAQISPGQSDTGNIVGQAISSGMRTYGQAKQNQHLQQIAALDLENRKLQNEWLQKQIDASAVKTLEARANSYPETYRQLRMTRDPAMSALLPKMKPLPSKAIPLNPNDARERTAITSDGDIVIIPPGTAAEDLEREVGEWSNVMPDTVHRAWEVFKRQLMKKSKRFTDKQIEYYKRQLPSYKGGLPSGRWYNDPHYRRF